MKAVDVIKLIVSIAVSLIAGVRIDGVDYQFHPDVVRLAEQAVVHPS
jgi:hypothetical protein